MANALIHTQHFGSVVAGGSLLAISGRLFGAGLFNILIFSIRKLEAQVLAEPSPEENRAGE